MVEHKQSVMAKLIADEVQERQRIEAENTRLLDLYLICGGPSFPRPKKRLWRKKRCPLCEAVLNKISTIWVIDYRELERAGYYTCPQCDYEFVG